MTIFYFNDTQHKQKLFTNGLGNEHYFSELDPGQGMTVTYSMPEKSVPFIKIWSRHIVMFSYMEEQATSVIESTF